MTNLNYRLANLNTDLVILKWFTLILKFKVPKYLYNQMLKAYQECSDQKLKFFDGQKVETNLIGNTVVKIRNLKQLIQ